jgi:hypothetical protein
MKIYNFPILSRNFSKNVVAFLVGAVSFLSGSSVKVKILDFLKILGIKIAVILNFNNQIKIEIIFLALNYMSLNLTSLYFTSS